MTLLKDKAIQAMLLGNWKNATSLNKALIKENPKDIDAMNRLAYALPVLRNLQPAQPAYKLLKACLPLRASTTLSLRKRGKQKLFRL